MTTHRKLAAILAADAAGYSRLMADDEAATLRALNESRDLFRKRIDAHGGRLIDTAGDSILAEFPSAVEAVDCADEIQHELAKRNHQLAEHRRMQFRIGINLGDVIEQEDGTIYGDGVNVAARLQALAEPGGICISGTAFDHVEGKLPLQFKFTGEQQVKNMTRLVRVYMVLADTHTSGQATSRESLQLPDKPSIAVLPFANLSADSAQEYFADGITEDLITALSRNRWLFVIARNSTFTYKGQSPDIRTVSGDLGVRYVLEGSVRREGNRLRITAQLIDGTSGTHAWAERYDRELEDIFVIQDEISETIAATIELEIGEVERERARRLPPENLRAWEAYQRGLWHLYKFSAEDIVEARNHLMRAIELDPHFSLPHGALAYTHYLDVILGFTKSPDESRAKALEAGRNGVAIDDKDPLAHFGLGRALTLKREYEEAIVQLEIATTLNPNFALGYMGLGVALAGAGHPEKAVESLDKAIRLSPHGPFLWTMENMRASTRITMGQYELAIDDARRACRHPNAGFWPYAALASALGHLGRKEEARIALEKFLAIKPDFSVKLGWETSAVAAKNFDTYLNSAFIQGLRKAGLEIPKQEGRMS
jgi:adenylate cyclase